MARLKKQVSRSQRWTDAADAAIRGLQDLLDIQSEFEEWYENMPENLQSSPVGEKLETVCEFDISGALDTATEAIDAELPLGFGRD